jgi:hypothetical protein
VTPITVDAEAEAELVAARAWYRANARPGISNRFRRRPMARDCVSTS